MTNPKPSLFQCLVLHAIADGDVTFEGEIFDGGFWFAWMTDTRRRVNVTKQVGKLIDGGYVQTEIDFPGLSVQLTAKGTEVLKRRPIFDLMEQLNRSQT